MPQIPVSNWQVDYQEFGDGRLLLLLHASLSGNKQWLPYAKQFCDRYRVIAPNFFGNGKSSQWPADAQQTLDDQLTLISPLLADCDSVDIVGHSLGGAIAMQAALRFHDKVQKLVLLEPTHYRLISNYKGGGPYRDIMNMFTVFQAAHDSNDWQPAAEMVSNFWHGPDAWSEMSKHHRIAVTWRMPPVFHELQAILSNKTPIETLAKITAKTLVVRGRTTVPAIMDTFELLQKHIPQWSYQVIGADGHMFPVSKPDMTYQVLSTFLDGDG
ncbi:MAG: hypothetical protein COA91_06170 [Robiginitomaculum sp.]|nr:MAG: hypothetical protein COA91_06170 [Robiginitomaculum sp.]